MYNVWLTALGKIQREELPDLLAAFRNMEIGKDNLEQKNPAGNYINRALPARTEVVDVRRYASVDACRGLMFITCSISAPAQQRQHFF